MLRREDASVEMPQDVLDVKEDAGASDEVFNNVPDEELVLQQEDADDEMLYEVLDELVS